VVAVRKPNAAFEGDSSIGYRGDPSTNVVHRVGTGIGSVVTTGDGTILEVVWAGGEGLTTRAGSAMFDALNQIPNWDDDPDERRMRKERAKKARAAQLSKVGESAVEPVGVSQRTP
jgi:hypothetical protein